MTENGSSDGRIYIHELYNNCGRKKQERIALLFISKKPIKMLYRTWEGAGVYKENKSPDGLSYYIIQQNGITFTFGSGENSTKVFKTWSFLQKELDKHGLPKFSVLPPLNLYGISIEAETIAHDYSSQGWQVVE